MLNLTLRVLSATVLILLFISCESDTEVIATVGDLEITKTEYTKELERYYPKQDLSQIELKRKQDVLNRLIENRLYVQAAYEMDIESDFEYQAAMRDQRNRVLGNLYTEKVIIDALVSEEQVAEYLERQSIEIKVSHILLGHEKSNRAVPRSRDEALELANKLAQEAREGARFEDLVAKHSNDPNAPKTKGSLPYFTWGRMVAPFQEAAWDLKPGEISEPVETRYGFHVILMEDKRPVPNYQPKTDRESLFRIKQTLARAYGDSGRVLWQKENDKLEEKYGFEKRKENISDIAAYLTKAIKYDLISYEYFSDSVKAVIFTKWDGGAITFGSILDAHRNNLLQAAGRFRKVEILEREVDRLSTVELVMTDAFNRGLHEDEIVSTTMEEFKMGQLARIAERRHIHDKIELKPEEIEEYYNTHPDRFVIPAEMEMWEIFVRSRDKIDMIMKKVKSGIPFEKLAREYTEDKRLADKGGYHGFRGRNSRGTMSRLAFEIGPGGKIGGPVEYRKGWSIVKTGELRDRRIRPFNQVKSRAESLLKNDRITTAKVLWEMQLKDKYPVNIFEERLQQI